MAAEVCMQGRILLRRGNSLSEALAGPEHYDIPAGHAGSDMRSTACNIGLNRRRDLSLRADVLLHTSEKSISLTDLLRVSLKHSCIILLIDPAFVCTTSAVSHKNLLHIDKMLNTNPFGKRRDPLTVTKILTRDTICLRLNRNAEEPGEGTDLFGTPTVMQSRSAKALADY